MLPAMHRYVDGYTARLGEPPTHARAVSRVVVLRASCAVRRAAVLGMHRAVPQWGRAAPRAGASRFMVEMVPARPARAEARRLPQRVIAGRRRS